MLSYVDEVSREFLRELKDSYVLAGKIFRTIKRNLPEDERLRMIHEINEDFAWTENTFCIGKRARRLRLSMI